MNETLFRIRKVFLDSGKSQTEIGNKIGKTSQYVWKLLNNDDANPSESVIRDICREFNINEEWLRNGTPPMKISPTGKLAAYVAEITHGDDEFIKDLIEVYMELDEDSKKALRVITDRMIEKRKERG